MKVVAVEELLLRSKSLSLTVKVAVLVIWPDAEGKTTIVTAAEAPAARLTSVQFTVFVPLQRKCGDEAEIKATPAGKVSVTTRFVAVAGPLLVTASRYERLSPT